jgi:hypothetical protein
MSDKCPSVLKVNHMFVPQPLEPVQVCKQTVMLYLDLDLTIKTPKCSHAFQINKTVLAVPGIDHRTILDTLGVQLNLSMIINSIVGDWNCHFYCNWCSFTNLTILSFHSIAGTQVN